MREEIKLMIIPIEIIEDQILKIAKDMEEGRVLDIAIITIAEEIIDLYRFGIVIDRITITDMYKIVDLTTEADYTEKMQE